MRRVSFCERAAYTNTAAKVNEKQIEHQSTRAREHDAANTCPRNQSNTRSSQTVYTERQTLGACLQSPVKTPVFCLFSYLDYCQIPKGNSVIYKENMKTNHMKLKM